jgi:hypothetical protein
MNMNVHCSAKRSITVPESEAMEYRAIVRGIKAIWKRMAFFEPETNGGVIHFVQK